MLISLAKFRYIEINVETQRLGSSGSMLVGIANRIMYYEALGRLEAPSKGRA